jgi:hypothetical protein
MSENPFPPQLRQFIVRYIHSVEQLEILCLLIADPSRSWTPAEVFRNIQSSERSVAACLARFCDQGLLVSETGPSYRFAPSSPGLAQTACDLAKAYHERRVSVIEAIYKKPADSIQDFLDAFKFRKDK